MDMGDQTNQSPNIPSQAADFETAISASGYGFFNILLLLTVTPAALAIMFEVASVSFILPNAECDLYLSLIDKGILNAITYAGMIISAIPWGYFADIKGRKKMLVLGLALDIFCVICSSLSQNVLQLMIFKFLGGMAMCGPFAILMSYITEMHGKQHRQCIMILVGVMFTSTAILLPILAVLILPNQWNFEHFGFKIYSWHIFLAVCSIPSILSASMLTLFPESPKFLMSQGRDEEALKVFKMIYALNKWKPKDTFPIKELEKEVPEKLAASYINPINTKSLSIKLSTDVPNSSSTAKTTLQLILKSHLMQLRPLFLKPYLTLSITVYLLNFCLLMSQNTVRLWLPQLFASITEYQNLANEVPSMCTIIEFNVNKTDFMDQISSNKNCDEVLTSAAYTNNIIVGLSGFFGYFVAGVLINKLGMKRMLIISALISAICGFLLYWSSSSLMTVILSSILFTTGSISATSTISISASLFPTPFRTTVLSLVMMFGRVGSLLGNVLFPILMSMGCIAPFMMITLVLLGSCILSNFLPNPYETAFK